MGTAVRLDTLPPFWKEAGLPADAIPYLEFQSRRYPGLVEALAPARPFDGRRILDVGGGAGSLVVVLQATYGGSYDLAEVSAPGGLHAAALRRRGVEGIHAVDLSAPHPLDGLRSDYDLLLFVEVLEHLLVNPLLLFREFWTHLKPGGFLFLTTPNPARVLNRARLLLGRSIKEGGRYPLEPGKNFGHVIEYGRAELDRLLGVEGFDPVAHRVVQQPPAPTAGWARRWGTRLLNARALARWELGDDILALYRKGERPVPRVTDPSGRI